jgi:hypothetical protein
MIYTIFSRFFALTQRYRIVAGAADKRSRRCAAPFLDGCKGRTLPLRRDHLPALSDRVRGGQTPPRSASRENLGQGARPLLVRG